MMYFLGIYSQVTNMYLLSLLRHLLTSCTFTPTIVSSNDELMSMSTSHPSVSSTGDTHEKLRQLGDGRRGKGAGEEPNQTTSRKPGPL